MKTKLWTPFIIVGLLIVLVVCLFKLTARPTHKIRGPSVKENTALEMTGKPLPEFTMIDAKERSRSHKEFSGKPLLIMEWASWCSDCQKQLPVIQQLYEQYGNKIHFLLINLTDPEKEPHGQAKSYVEKNQFTFPYYYDDGQKIADSLLVETIPTIYLVDNKQTIQRVIVGPQDKVAIEKEIQVVIKK